MSRVRGLLAGALATALVVAGGASSASADLSDGYDQVCSPQLYLSDDPYSPPLLAGPPPSGDLNLPDRIAGADRYATAATIADVWAQHFDIDIAFVTTGENFPDALSAAPVAAYLGGPVLLTRTGSLPGVTRARLLALAPPRIVVLGDERSVSASVMGELAEIAPVERWAGADRYATMREIVGNAWEVDGNGDGDENVSLSNVIVATGQGYADALSAAAAAGATGGAVILVDGSQATVPSATLALIRDLDPARIYVVGGIQTVTCGIARQLDTLFPATHVKRVFHYMSRYGTSMAIADYFVAYTGSRVGFLTTGLNYPDALTGAALAGALRAPVVTTHPLCLPLDTRALFSWYADEGDEIVVLGDGNSVSPAVLQHHYC